MVTGSVGDPIEVSSLTLGESAVLEHHLQEQSFIASADPEGGTVG